MFDEKRKALVSERLKSERKNIGLSHSNLAIALRNQYGIRISPDVLKNYEASEVYHVKFGACSGMRIEYLVCLADYFHVSTDYLLGRTDIRELDTSLQALQQTTNLSDKAIKELCCISNGTNLSQTLSDFLDNDHFEDLLNRMMQYVHLKQMQGFLEENELKIPRVERYKELYGDADVFTVNDFVQARRVLCGNILLKILDNIAEKCVMKSDKIVK